MGTWAAVAGWAWIDLRTTLMSGSPMVDYIKLASLEDNPRHTLARLCQAWQASWQKLTYRFDTAAYPE